MAHKKTSTRRSAPRTASTTTAPARRPKKRSTSTRRTTSPRSSKSFSIESVVKDFLPVAGIIGGFALASMIDKKFTTPSATAVSGLMGLEGTEANKYVKPLLTVAIGLGARHFIANEHVRNASLGIMAYGGLGGIEAITGKKISLNGIEDEPIKGIGETDALQKAIEEALKATPPTPQIAVKGTESVQTVNGLDDTEAIKGAEDLSGNDDLFLSGNEDLSGNDDLGETEYYG